MTRLNNIIRIIKIALRPITDKPILFVVLTLLGSCVPLISVICGEPRRMLLLQTVAESSLFAYIFCALSLFTRKKWIDVTVTTLYSAWALIEVMHRLLLHYPVSYNSVMLALGTNAEEINGFTDTFITSAVITVILIGVATTIGIIILVTKQTYRLPIWAALPMIAMAVAGAVIVPSRLAFIPLNDYNRFLVWESQGSGNPELINAHKLNFASPVSKSLYIAKYVLLQTGLADKWKAVQREYMKEQVECNADADLQLAVVIGESFIKSHSSLYGYHLDVNPVLKKEFDAGNLIAFQDYITSANFTVASIRNLLNTNCLNGNNRTVSDWYNSAYLPLIFYKGNWSINLLSNQYAPGDAMGDLGGMFFDNMMTDSCYTANNRSTRRFDLDFIKAMTDSLTHLTKPRGRALDIWHLKGQHFPPKNDFPIDNPEFRRFSYKDIPSDRDWLDRDKRQTVADYANATLYNDSVMGYLLSLYRDKKVILVYFSDHGEEMYDSAPFANRNRQRPEDREWLHRQFDIPMFVWFSDSAKKEMPELYELVVQSSERPGMLDSLPQLLMHLGGLTRSSTYSATHDILSPQYQLNHRITALGYKYD